ncbi:MAG: hypothetical protein JF627_09195 [Alphaproteobacteria bacterium]|nr:hypothetical protein [Alphaproteobacteria bacterium]
MAANTCYSAETDKMSEIALVFGSAATQQYKGKKSEIERVMRKSYVKTGAVVTAIALSLSGASFADPLAPGKPAGVHQAQMGDKEWLVFGGLGLVVAGLLIATAGGGHDASSPQAITASIPTST